MSGERILILDDNEGLRESVENLLKTAGYVTETAGTCEEALERASQHEFEALLADVYLPDRTGLEAFQEIRARQPDLAGIVMTGYSTWEVAMEALRVGFAGFLVKPFGPEQLISAVVSALEKEKLQRENSRLQALVPLYELSRHFMSAGDLPELLHEIVQIAQQETGAEVVSLMLTDEGRRELSIAAAEGLPVEVVESQRRALGEGIAGWVAEHGKPLMIAEGVPLDPEVRRAMGQPNVLSALSLPLSTRGQVIGVLNLSRLRGAEPFGRGDLELASVLAGQAAIAIDKARVIDELRLLSETSQQLAAALDLEQAAAVITDATMRLLGARRVALWLIEEISGRPALHRAVNFSESELKMLTPPSAAFLTPAERFQVRGDFGTLSLPIVRGNRKLGLIEVHFATARRPREDRLSLMRTLTQTAATVIEAHRLRAREMIAFRELDSALRSDLNLRGMLERVLNEMIQACSADGGGVYLWGADQKLLESWAEVGLKPSKELAEAVLRERVPVTLSPELAEGQAGEARAVIGAQMIIAGHTYGAVVLTHRERGAFEGQHLNLLSVLSSTAALIFRNAQLYARSEESAITEERTRIARDIHDGLAQDLTFLVFKLEAVRKLIASGQTVEVDKELGEVTAVLRNDMREARRIIFALRPLELESLGFLLALSKFVNDFGTTNDIKTHLKVAGDARRLTSKSEIALFRLTQESLNNVRKHAQAANIWVDLAIEAEGAELAVRDDGKGFEEAKALQAAQRRGSVGIVQMRERAERAGGTLNLATAPGKGTEIRVMLPMK